MIEIDGGLGEGGGQIVRSALALAAVLGKEVKIFNIRAGRDEPGLKAQHLTGAKAIARVSNASVEGLEIGSTKLVFKPRSIDGGKFRFEVGTAGSITLVLEALMPLLPYATQAVSLEVSGGTDVRWSPPVDYLKLVTMPVLARMGLLTRLQVVVRGHYPKGGGLVRVESSPSGRLHPLSGQVRGVIKRIVGVSHSAKLPRHVAERQAASASTLLIEKGLPTPEIDVEAHEDGLVLSPGSGVVLSAESENSSILGGDALGEKGRPAELVGRNAAEKLLAEVGSGCFLDRHMGDMIIPYLTLAEGESDITVSRVTQHLLTNVTVSEQIGGVHFDPVGKLGATGKVRVSGVGFARS